MRVALLAALTAMTIGLVGTSAVTAAPINATAANLASTGRVKFSAKYDSKKATPKNKTMTPTRTRVLPPVKKVRMAAITAGSWALECVSGEDGG